MLSKWVRFYSKHYNRFILSVFVGALFSLPVREVHALITLSPSNAGSVSGSTSTGGTFYYFVMNPAPTSPDFINFAPIDPTKFSINDSGLANMVEFYFYSDKLFQTTGQPVVIMAQTSPATTPARPIPIAAINGVSCSANGNGICIGQNQIPSPSTGTAPAGNNQNLYYAVSYPTPQATVRVGIYPSDICAAYAASGGGAAQGCVAGDAQTSILTAPQAGTPTTMQVSFSLVNSPNLNPTTMPSTTPTLDSMTTPVTLSFGVDSPVFACTDPNTLASQGYTPGDTQIYLNTTLFGLSSTSTPASSLIVVGNVGTAPNTQSLGFLQNTLVAQSIPLGVAAQPVGGFVNSTQSIPVPYFLSFIIQDASGIYAPPNPTVNSCILEPVYTGAIQGLLSKNGCFIATAAFRSIDATPVVLLREFRDRVLLRSSLGESFVNWYYSWSPGAAEWLNLHPVFRCLVLLSLSPLEMIAWICLHPQLLLIIFVTCMVSGAVIWGRANET